MMRCTLALCVFCAGALLAQRGPGAPTAPAAAEPTPVPPENSSVTEHELTLDGKALHYAATAGTLLIDDEEEKPYGSIFYVAYTLAGVSDPRTRPVTFLYNGGPGSASVPLHMASVGPMRVVTASPAASGPAPYQLIPNQYSLLDKSDLVFVDAPGTGFSRPVGRATIRNFAGTDQDVQAFLKFIERYIGVNHRWNSPKFLFGESYGTTRSAALVDALESDGVAINGVVLMSTILNYFTLAPGSDAVFIGNLPTYAAIAEHYEKVQHKGKDLAAFLNEVRAFARGPYAEALAQGHNLPAPQVDAIAAKLAGYTGLSQQFLKEANLRVSPVRFRKELMRDQRMILGRYDARFEGTDTDAAGENPGYDPSGTGVSGAFVTAFHDYLDRELKYTSKETYFPHGPNVNQMWDHTHRPPATGGAGGGQAAAPPLRDAYVAGDLADAMRKDPNLKVFSVNGLFDLATPFFITEFDLSHMELEPKLRQNIEFAYYPSGHMIYLNVDALKQLKTDLATFYAKAAPGAR
ncbi:MAG: peptidase S10 [Candidatus Sulfopaludibacter sp.]|nr:peptidase S10 [Candidatus Sulfopaludibacter sp.]